MFGANCSNCGQWTDMGKIVGQCMNKDSDHFRSPTRYDFSCASHPMIIRMLEDTVCGGM